MNREILMLLIGLILGIVVTLPLTVVASSDITTNLTGTADSHPMQVVTSQPGATHQRMHETMDAMHGQGFSERMHQEMPGPSTRLRIGSEEMMEECARHMEDMPDGHMMGMMMGGGMHGMMDHPSHER